MSLHRKILPAGTLSMKMEAFQLETVIAVLCIYVRGIGYVVPEEETLFFQL